MMTYIVGVKPFKGVQDFLFQCFYLSIKDPNGCVAKILLNVWKSSYIIQKKSCISFKQYISVKFQGSWLKTIGWV